MNEEIEKVLKRITSTLVESGCFVNYAERSLLEDVLGDICSIREDIYIEGALLAMRPDLFYPVKILIPIMHVIKSKKLLLSLFIESMKERMNLGVNWKIMLAPLKTFRTSGNIILHDINKFFNSLKFINMCSTEGIKILDDDMLSNDSLMFVNLPIEVELKIFSKTLLKLWFNSINREQYLATIRNASNLFKRRDIQNDALKKSSIAHLLFCVIELYDLRKMVDLTEKLMPYYVFKPLNRDLLKEYLDHLLMRLMGHPKKYRSKFDEIELKLKKLISDLYIPEMNEYMLLKKVYNSET